jgi:cytochrome c peroxidase
LQERDDDCGQLPADVFRDKMKRNVIIFLFVAVIAGLSISFISTEEIRFVIPKGWPKPTYDFSKNKLSEGKFKLGRKLFFDPILSRDSSTSCASCHLQFSGFTHVDHSLSHGINGLKGTRNSSTIFNMAWSRSFMWDGGVNNIEVQPLNPITNPVEMDSQLEDVVMKLNRSAYYRKRFYKAFNDSVINSQKLLKSLAQFVLMLESFNSKYDKVIRKEGGIEFTEQEKKGYALFKKNCASCHTEPLFTNNSFENNGLPPDAELKDGGRIKITRNAADSLKFKVPSLRNVAVSYPYMHDGRFKNLKQVLDHYASGIQKSETLAKQLNKGIQLNDEEKEQVLAFLQTLTDKEFLFDLRFRNYIME